MRRRARRGELTERDRERVGRGRAVRIQELREQHEAAIEAQDLARVVELESQFLAEFGPTLDAFPVVVPDNERALNTAVQVGGDVNAADYGGEYARVGFYRDKIQGVEIDYVEPAAEYMHDPHYAFFTREAYVEPEDLYLDNMRKAHGLGELGIEQAWAIFAQGSPAVRALLVTEVARNSMSTPFGSGYVEPGNDGYSNVALPVEAIRIHEFQEPALGEPQEEMLADAFVMHGTLDYARDLFGVPMLGWREAMTFFVVFPNDGPYAYPFPPGIADSTPLEEAFEAYSNKIESWVQADLEQLQLNLRVAGSSYYRDMIEDFSTQGIDRNTMASMSLVARYLQQGYDEANFGSELEDVLESGAFQTHFYEATGVPWEGEAGGEDDDDEDEDDED